LLIESSNFIQNKKNHNELGEEVVNV
jgi:hypothetical protein